MPTTQPRDPVFIVPSRFGLELPRTWQLVMDDAGHALAERYGNDMSPHQVLDEASLRHRDRYMQEVARQQAAPVVGEANGKRRNLHDTIGPLREPCEQRTNTMDSHVWKGCGALATLGVAHLDHHHHVRENDSDNQREQLPQYCAASSYGGVLTEVPVSLFH